MRLVWMLPLTYIAGIEGFGWFVPYLLFLAAAATLIARLRKARSVQPRAALSLTSDAWLEPVALPLPSA